MSADERVQYLEAMGKRFMSQFEGYEEEDEVKEEITVKCVSDEEQEKTPQSEIDVIFFQSKRKESKPSSYVNQSISHERKLFMSSNINTVMSSSKVDKTKANKSVIQEDELVLEENPSFVRENLEVIKDMGASSLSFRERRIYEKRKLEKIGAKAPKNEKMPYHRLMDQRKRVRVKESKQQNWDREVGNMVQKSKAGDVLNWRTKKEPIDNRFGGAISRKSQIGKEKDGVLKLSHTEISSIMKSGRMSRMSKMMKRR